MSPDTPEMTVALSVYDGVELPLLAAALDSVLCQQGVTFEVCIVLDGISRADLGDFLANQAAADARIRLIHFPNNRKLPAAMNAIVRDMNSDLFVRMDADDLSMPGRFAALTRFMRENPDIDAAGSWSYEFDIGDPQTGLIRQYPTEHDAIIARFNYNNPFCHPSMVFRRGFFDLGLYPLWTLNEDTMLFLNGYVGGARFANIPVPLYAHRYDADVSRRRTSWKRAGIIWADRQRVISRCGGGSRARFYATMVLAAQTIGAPLYPWLRRLMLKGKT